MTALSSWNLLPIGFALAAFALVAQRARALLFDAALDGGRLPRRCRLGWRPPI